jgi:hypothetical protein
MKSKKLFFPVVITFCIFVITGCVTYYIPVQSFKEQFQGITESNLKTVKVQGPVGYITEYKANPIEEISCIDKKGNPFILKNSPSIEVRFTDNNNKRTIYYFDRIFLKDTLIVGDISRFLPGLKALSINDIKLIEIQDGHKNFKYIEVK